MLMICWSERKFVSPSAKTMNVSFAEHVRILIIWHQFVQNRGKNGFFFILLVSSIQRGCVSDSDNICGNREHCFFCDGHGCNSFNATYDQIPLAPSSATLTFSSIVVMIVMMMAAKIFH